MLNGSGGALNKRVYSSDGGRMCPNCGRPAGACACRNPKAATPGDGVLRVARESKGRKGKGVTVVTGVPLAGGELSALAKELKNRCGAGGTV